MAHLRRGLYRAHESFSPFGVSLATRSDFRRHCGVPRGSHGWKHALGSGLSWPEVSHPSRSNETPSDDGREGPEGGQASGMDQAADWAQWIAHLEGGLGEAGYTFEPAGASQGQCERPEGEDPWTTPRSRASQDATAI